MTINKNTIDVNTISMLDTLNSIKTNKVNKTFHYVKIKSNQDGTEVSAINLKDPFTITSYDKWSKSENQVEFVGNYYELLDTIKDLDELEGKATITVDDNNVEVSKEFLSYSLDTVGDASDYNVLKPEEVKSKVTLKLGGTKEIKGLIKNLTTMLKFTAKRDVLYPIISCINLKVENEKMTLAGIDGYKLMTTNYNVTGDDLEVNLNSTFINNLINLLKNNIKDLEKIDIMVDDSNKVVYVKINDIILAGNNNEGEFFDYQDLLSSARGNKRVLVLETRDLKKTLNSITKKQTKVSEDPVIFEINKDVTTVHNKYNNIKATFDIKHAYELKIGFNPYYLVDCLNNIDDRVVTMQLCGSTSPVYIKNENNEYLVLPIMLK